MEAHLVTFICMACFKETTEWVLVNSLTPFEITQLCWRCYSLSTYTKPEGEK
jgi:hypothetical protein